MSLNQDFFLGQIVLQPTTACNLNCTYCYLPNRKQALQMSPSVTECLATSITEMNLNYAVPLVWHGGEPLMLGKTRFAKLIEPLEILRVNGKIVHGLQTNGASIDQEWCEFFKKYGFEIGVSIDGPSIQNHNRLDWHGQETFQRTMLGITCLKKFEIPFTCIAVVTNDALDYATEIYQFFRNLGCRSVGINPEE